MTSREPFAAANDKVISIVDDELDITQLFSDAICQNIEEVSVVSFNDPVEALEHFSENKKMYALVISDLKMPNLNGLELLKGVKQVNPKIRTILVSAFDVESDPVFKQYLREGIIDKFVQKPIMINTLCQKVTEQIRTFRSMAFPNHESA